MPISLIGMRLAFKPLEEKFPNMAPSLELDVSCNCLFYIVSLLLLLFALLYII